MELSLNLVDGLLSGGLFKGLPALYAARRLCIVAAQLLWPASRLSPILNPRYLLLTYVVASEAACERYFSLRQFFSI